MIPTFLGLLANVTSFILWLPQARTTFKNRHNPEALKGISLGTQIIAAINTSAWCLYGLFIHDAWLPLGTLIVLPLALWAIVLKLKANRTPSINVKKPNQLLEYGGVNKNGYFEVNLGDTTLCDHQGQRKLKQFDTIDEIVAYCKKHKITHIQLSEGHYHEDRNYFVK